MDTLPIMNSALWIRRSRPSALSAPNIEVGSPGLLSSWMNEVVTHPRGSLLLVTPFVDEGLLDRSGPVGWFWHSLDHKAFCLRIWTLSLQVADRLLLALSHWRWSDLNVHFGGPLHAKAYVHLTPEGNGSALLGSMNFTAAGLRGVGELGVLVRAQGNPGLRQLVTALHSGLYVEMMAHPLCEIQQVTKEGSNVKSKLC